MWASRGRLGRLLEDGEKNIDSLKWLIITHIVEGKTVCLITETLKVHKGVCSLHIYLYIGCIHAVRFLLIKEKNWYLFKNVTVQ